MVNSGAVMKAVMITEANRSYLEQRYGADDDQREPLMPGLFLVASFGNGEDETPADYDLVEGKDITATFNVTGVKLENGFFEIVGR